MTYRRRHAPALYLDHHYLIILINDNIIIIKCFCKSFGFLALPCSNFLPWHFKPNVRDGGEKGERCLWILIFTSIKQEGIEERGGKLSMFLAAKVKFCEQKLNNAENEEFRDKRRIPLPNRMIFWKNSKQPLTRPPPHFWKIMLQIFYKGYGRIYARR